jgi:hypothetical protein
MRVILGNVLLGFVSLLAIIVIVAGGQIAEAIGWEYSMVRDLTLMVAFVLAPIGVTLRAKRD